jgi:hypothetical protein
MAGVDAGPVVVWNDMTDPTRWLTFTITSAPGLSGPFSGGTFDGRYVYLAPAPATVPTRYDTTQSFISAAAWSEFNVAATYPGAVGYHGGAIVAAGGVLFVPYYTGTAYHGFTVRYDPSKPFDMGSSWLEFNTNTLLTGSVGYSGSAFDGRYVYYAPNIWVNGAMVAVRHGRVARYDTTLPFDLGTSWAVHDATTENAGSVGFQGAVYAAGYVYFVPHYNTAYDGLVTRYNTRTAFDLASSWGTFDTATLNSQARGFVGGVFDGRYVYFVPYANAPATFHGNVVRYDTQAPFSTATSWVVFDAGTVNPAVQGFTAGGFDGRYAYFSPNSSGTIVRYDTTAAFADLTSWQAFDLLPLNASAKGYFGSVFDGEYMYFIPSPNGGAGNVVARFDARTPRTLTLPYNGGSFW